ncbi:helix-turn-helix transcriptional regulator [Carboxylicivirga mesophila]|uniref:Helix-turn-helix transcriptional regulator n=1 Tax=Carboxylicivirga mesophila TaxID=1166478 RepID=A0ABS5K710_9BACT|nr:helix-turn-helix transcriptional regulator [Carboxylicivirga mesophila]MBS2210746.1 helix-turn-helix transcriptional regulator [Carboxylicivirga mesophila]
MQQIYTSTVLSTYYKHKEADRQLAWERALLLYGLEQTSIGLAFEQYSNVTSLALQQFSPDLVYKAGADFIVIASDKLHLKDISTIKQLKSDVRTAHIPIIGLLKQFSDLKHISWLNAGVDQVFQWSIDVRVLLASAHALIKERKRLKHLYQKSATIESGNGNGSLDQLFISRARNVVLDNYSDTAFNIEQFVSLMNVSRTMLYVKIKQLTGKTTSEFVRDIRLEEAARLLKDGMLNVSEVAYKVGFKDPKYLSKKFKIRFGTTPSDFRRGR